MQLLRINAGHAAVLCLQVRNKLAPIRGIPTKQGLQNPNQDLLDIFAFWDSVPRLPQIVIGNIASCKCSVGFGPASILV
eukprot:1159682-Pelagomonas_calceolata.AAC.2